MDHLKHLLERSLRPRVAWGVLLVLGMLTVGAAINLRHIRLDFDFERFFPREDPELDRYLAFRERFGSDMDLLLIAVEHPPSVFDTAFLRRVDQATTDLLALADVEEVRSPTRLTDPRITPVGVFQVPVLRFDEDSLLRADSARVRRDPELFGTFFSEQGDALLLVLNSVPGLSKVRSDDLLERIRIVLDRHGLSNARLGGRLAGQQHYIALMERELITFFSASVLLLALFLALTFRTWWGVVVPIGVVGLTVLWQVSLMTLLGKPLTVLTMLLPTILFVVGMSDVVHILERYIESLRNGRTKHQALLTALWEVGLATFLTSVTTAIGFLTLLTSRIEPIREFGVYTAMGVGMAFVLAFTLLPAVLLLVPTPVGHAAATGGPWWKPLHALLRFTLRRQRAITLVFVGVGILCALAIPRVQVDNFLLEDLPGDDAHRADFNFLETHFGGVRPFELEMELIEPGADIWDPAVLKAMERIGELSAEAGASGILSPATLVARMHQALNGGDPSYQHVPDDPEETRRAVRLLRTFMGRDQLAMVADSTGRAARLTARSRDEGGRIHLRKDEALLARIAADPVTAPVRVHVTGMAHLIDLNNRTLSAQLVQGLSLAFLLIAGLMALVFRDVRVIVVALLPNVFPLVVVAGYMGIMGIDLKVSTSIIFTIAFGIAVDDTIHMLGKLRVEQRKGRTLLYALKRAHLSAGRAIIVTSLMLFSGFIALTASSFATVHHLGLLVGITLLVAVLADLLLLPVLVLRLLRR